MKPPENHGARQNNALPVLMTLAFPLTSGSKAAELQASRERLVHEKLQVLRGIRCDITNKKIPPNQKHRAANVQTPTTRSNHAGRLTFRVGALHCFHYACLNPYGY